MMSVNQVKIRTATARLTVIGAAVVWLTASAYWSSRGVASKQQHVSRLSVTAVSNSRHHEGVGLYVGTCSAVRSTLKDVWQSGRHGALLRA